MSPSMASNTKPLHIAIFPLMSPGHMLPLIDIALLLAGRGVHITLITTPSEAAAIRPTIDRASNPHLSIALIPFPPPSLTGLALGNENLATNPAAHLDTFLDALAHFEPPLTALLHSLRPDCLISDSLFPWTSDLAISLSIPRLVFHGPGAFSMFLIGRLPFPVPTTPTPITIKALPHTFHLHTETLPVTFHNIPLLVQLGAAEGKSFGAVLNSFYALEPTYIDYIKSTKKVWCVGPSTLYSPPANDITPDNSKLLKWLDGLDGVQEGSVVYICFGSLCHFTSDQLRELALGLEASGQRFIWVVRKEAEEDQVDESWMPEGFEARMSGKGMVVRGWCPQKAVLAHPAVGWFVTHCGWSSVLEAVCAGVGMVTWPLFHEQFMNQELVVKVMGAGVRTWEERGKRGVVKAEEIEKVLKMVGGGGEEVAAVRRKAAEYKKAAREAMEEGGTTYNDVTELLEELEATRNQVAPVVINGV